MKTREDVKVEIAYNSSDNPTYYAEGHCEDKVAFFLGCIIAEEYLFDTFYDGDLLQASNIETLSSEDIKYAYWKYGAEDKYGDTEIIMDVNKDDPDAFPVTVLSIY